MDDWCSLEEEKRTPHGIHSAIIENYTNQFRTLIKIPPRN